MDTVLSLQEMCRSNPVTATGRMKISRGKKGWVSEEGKEKEKEKEKEGAAM